jgi:hypothetical protein
MHHNRTGNKISSIVFNDYAYLLLTPRGERLRHGLEHDGEEARDYWIQWMRDEDRYFEPERPDLCARIEVNGLLPWIRLTTKVGAGSDEGRDNICV